MNKKRTLTFFADEPAVLAYITSELLATLRDDLDTMQRSERQHYTGDDRKEIKAKIHDIEAVAPRITESFDILTEWVNDVDTVFDGASNLEDDWPDMFITYKKAKALIAHTRRKA